MQAGAPFATVQVVPQPPQLARLVFVLVSQPSAIWPLQLPKPGLQLAMPQAPPEHCGVPFGVEQRLPHIPQLPTLVFVLVSQPSATRPSQSA